jgi:hypothetical protein
MVYSSSKSSILQVASSVGLKVEQNVNTLFSHFFKLEVSDVEDLSFDLLHSYVHPVKVEETGFKKPSRPGKSKKK